MKQDATQPYINAPTRDTVSITKAMELTHVSRRTLYLWMLNGKVEWVRTAGGSRRIFTDTLFREGQ